MRFVIAAMRDTRFLTAAIVVTAALAILSDMISEKITLHLWDVSDLLMVVFAVMYLRAAEPDQQFREFIKGMLFGVVILLVVMYSVGGG